MLISGGLDGVVRFWTVPSKPAPMTEGPDEVISLENAAATLKLAADTGRRKSSSSVHMNAPPPSMAPSSNFMHKSSRADSMSDGVTLFSSSYADTTPEIRNTRTSFFTEEEDIDPSATTRASGPSSVSNSRTTSAIKAVLFSDAPASSPPPAVVASSTQHAGSQPEDHHQDSGAVEVPAAKQVEEEEADIF